MRKSVSLKGKRCFNEVFQNGKRLRTKGFRCVFVRNCESARGEPFCCHKSEQCSYKIGIIISRRFGTACERNRAKRQVREMVDLTHHGFVKNWCMAISIFDEFKGMSFKEGLASFQDMLKKAGIIRVQQ